LSLIYQRDPLTDSDILVAINTNRKAKEKAFNYLVSTYQEPIYWHIRKLVLLHEDANDVTQNCFIKAYKGIKNFKGKSSIKTWLFSIAYNESMNFLNKKKRRLRLSDESYNDQLLNELQEDVYFSGDEIELKFQKALLELPPQQKSIFLMRYHEDLKFKDIAQILNKSEGAIKASYHIATKKLKYYLNNL